MSQFLDTKSMRKAIKGHCFVRTFTPETVARLEVKTLLSMAVRAPTAIHFEPWGFIVVQESSTLKRISNIARDSMRVLITKMHHTGGNTALSDQKDLGAFNRASTLIVICAAQAGRFAQSDCWLAAQDLMLVAFGIGLASCVIGMSVSARNLPVVKLEHRIPSKFQAVAPIVVSIPGEEVTAISRKLPHILAWHSSESTALHHDF